MPGKSSSRLFDRLALRQRRAVELVEPWRARRTAHRPDRGSGCRTVPSPRRCATRRRCRSRRGRPGRRRWRGSRRAGSCRPARSGLAGLLPWRSASMSNGSSTGTGLLPMSGKRDLVAALSGAKASRRRAGRLPGQAGGRRLPVDRGERDTRALSSPARRRHGR